MAQFQDDTFPTMGNFFWNGLTPDERVSSRHIALNSTLGGDGDSTMELWTSSMEDGNHEREIVTSE
jgi:hypothetical protein